MSLAITRVSAIVLIVCSLVLVNPILAADCVWSGGTGDWDDPANWSDCNGGVPGPGDTAVIGSGQVNLGAGTTTVAVLEFSGGFINGPGVANELIVTDELLLTGDHKQIGRITVISQGEGLWDGGTLQFGEWRQNVLGDLIFNGDYYHIHADDFRTLPE